MSMRRRLASENQKIMDRARKARKERIFGDKSSHGRRGYSSGDADNQVGDKEGRGMVKVVRLNGEEIYLNMLQIEAIEQIPETKVKMMNGDYYLLKDSADYIMDQIRAFIKSCVVYEDKGK